jgi:hypothetical protein
MSTAQICGWLALNLKLPVLVGPSILAVRAAPFAASASKTGVEDRRSQSQ